MSVVLSKYTTLGTGGPAREFVQPTTIAEVEAVLRRGEPVAVVGLGSNLLAADEGVDTIVLHLEGERAEVSTTETMLRAGGGAANAVALHRARADGLGGFEFAC